MILKKIHSLVSIISLTIVLAACGTTTTESEKTDKPAPMTETSNSEETVSPTNPEQEELSGTTVESENQNYTITVVDDFELTSEEPNKDLIFNQENDLQSMRIETFDPSTGNLKDVTQNLVDTLQASNDSGTVVEFTDQHLIPTNESIEDVKAYQIDTPSGKVTGYTFVREGLIVKLTVFDTNESQALETFVKMAETIKVK